MRDFVRAAQALGYDAIEVSHVTDEEGLERLLGGSGARLTGVHAPAPKVTVKGKPNSELNLAALDEEERRLAIDHTRRSIDYAARAGARFVIVTFLASVVHSQFTAWLRDERGIDFVYAKMMADLAVFTFGQPLWLRYIVFPRSRAETLAAPETPETLAARLVQAGSQVPGSHSQTLR
jgi:sugar phosphate isomerase/epimerase